MPIRISLSTTPRVKRNGRGGTFAAAVVSTALLFRALSPLRAVSAEIVVRGTNVFQSVQIPSGLADITAVSVGRDHLLALRRDGTVLGFGYNGDGRAAPPPGLQNVTAIAAGIYDSLALKSDGTVVAWGFGGEGMTVVPAGLSGVVAIAAGGFHNLALLRGGAVVGWGYGGAGRTAPPPGLNRVIAISAGRDHSVALKADGTVVAWGQNDAGQTNVPAGLGGVVAIAAGNSHTLALKNDGTVAAWGANNQGECDVPAGLANVAQVAAGNGFSLALKTDGTVVAWGAAAALQGGYQSGLSALSAGGMQSAALTGGDGLRISQGPAGAALAAGGGTTLRVAATGAPNLLYQWYFNGQPLPGATNDTLTLNQAALGASGGYQVTVSSGTDTVSSPEALVQVWGGYTFTNFRFVGPSAMELSVGDWSGLPLSLSDFEGWTLQVSTNLLDWTDTPIQGTILDGQLRITDPAGSAVKFYRLKQAP